MTKPKFRCKQVPRAKNTRKLKPCRKIINNIFLGTNQFISVDNAYINQYNFFKCQPQGCQSPVPKSGTNIKEIKNIARLEPEQAVFSTKNRDALATKVSESNQQITSSKLLSKMESSTHSVSYNKENFGNQIEIVNNIQYLSTNKFCREDDYFSLVNTRKSNFPGNVQRKSITDTTQETVNDISSSFEKIVLKETTNLNNQWSLEKDALSMDNNAPNILCQLGHIIRMNTTKNINGKINKNFLNIKTYPKQFISIKPNENNQTVCTSETSTPKRSTNIGKTTKANNWELSPIVTNEEKFPESTEKVGIIENNLQDNQSTEFEKTDKSEDSFELTCYVYTCKTDSAQDNCIKQLSNSQNQDSLHVDENQSNDSSLQSSSFRTTPFKSFTDSHHAIENGVDDSQSSRSFFTIRNCTENIDDLFDSKCSTDFKHQWTKPKRVSTSENDSLCFSFDKRESNPLDVSSSLQSIKKGIQQKSICFERYTDFHSKTPWRRSLFSVGNSRGSFARESEGSERYTNIMPGKKWRQSLLAAANSRADSSTTRIDPSESYTNVMPGKKWKRSLRQSGNKCSTLLSYDLSLTRCSWNMRLSVNPQSYSEFDKSHKRNVTNKLHEVTELGTLDEHEEKVEENEYNSILNNSYFDSDDDEFNSTLTIHRQMTDILQSDTGFVSNTKHQRNYAEKKVMDLCNQQSLIDFDEYVHHMLKCKKIGEGFYGEVFSFSARKQETVLKIIPIEGEIYVNNTPQKTYSEVFSEVCVALSLSNLKNFVNGNYTNVFCSILKIICIKGKYPQKLIDKWNEYDKAVGSENDPPTMFSSDQVYVGLEMLPGGEPLEDYEFCSARQSYTILLQVTYALAAAEEAFEFEHRDLHWGNVLISKTNLKHIDYTIDGKKYEINTYGRKATIIDYTFSRIRSGKFDIYNNLENDIEIFQAYGDYQFDIYRDMRKDVNSQWGSFIPKTNVRWIHYLADKCYNGVYYKTKHKLHKSYLHKIRILRDKILNFSSATDLVNNLL